MIKMKKSKGIEKKLSYPCNYKVKCKIGENSTWTNQDESVNYSHAPVHNEIVTVVGHWYNKEGSLLYSLAEYPDFETEGWDAKYFERFHNMSF